MEAEAEPMELNMELADEFALERLELTEAVELAEEERELEERLAEEEFVVEAVVVVWAEAMALRAATMRIWNCMLFVCLFVQG